MSNTHTTARQRIAAQHLADDRKEKLCTQCPQRAIPGEELCPTCIAVEAEQDLEMIDAALANLKRIARHADYLHPSLLVRIDLAGVSA